MKNLVSSEMIYGENFKIYTENTRGIIGKLIEKQEVICIYDDFYKAIHKIGIWGTEEWEMLYMGTNNKYYLYVGVPRDSYLSQINVIINANECIAVFNEEQAIDYLEYRGAATIIIEFFSERLKWKKYKIDKPTLCFVKNRRVFDINKSYALKIHTNEYIRYGQIKSEYEELFINSKGEYFLYVLEYSVRTVNSNRYFRNKEEGEEKKGDVLPMGKEETIRWFLYRGGSSEQFNIEIEKSRLYFNKI
ncbi:hypothetical protein [Clostridium tagluense]|uniref:hypothetical protein n=1 Tax=Clostridium tagluense TaxID=360422 RepID=UPI001CF33EDC|nr:hypothetical protein [Clostridium tagluense]MCB2299877.1 hypothetical protein [Clostridium tagluense]